MLELPYPHKKLNPNTKVHWYERGEIARKHRFDCKALASQYKPRHEFKVEIHPPDNRKRDMQNVIAALKHAIDGLQDAWGIDDSEFVIHWPTRFEDPVKHGKVVIL